MATPRACVLAAGGRSLALIILVAACFGLPLDGWIAFAFLSFASVAALVGTIGTDRRRWAAAVAVALACIVLRNVLPAHQIEEGHSVFSPVAASLLADHAVFLFYPGYPRYTYGIWLLTLLVFAVVVRDVYGPAIARRLPAAARLRAPQWLDRVGWLDPAPA